MTLAHLFIAWSAALAALSAGAIVLALHRLYDGWETLDRRNCCILAGIVCAGIMGLAHQGDSTWLWMQDAYSTTSVRWSTWVYRAAGTAMIVLLGGGVAYPKCGHRGWIGLLLVGLAAGGVAVVAS